MSDPHKFLAEVEAFIAATGMSLAEFGLKAANDRNLVTQLRAGREPRSALREKVRAFIAGAKRGRSQAA